MAKAADKMVYGPSTLTDDDVFLFNEGSHFRLYEKLGAHRMQVAQTTGTFFAVWAPNAKKVSVVGDFNAWKPGAHPLSERGNSGIWEGFCPGLAEDSRYKYDITSNYRGYQAQKADPFGFFSEVAPLTASVTHDINYEWGDGIWMRERGQHSTLNSPQSIYEVHLGSWRRVPEEDNRSLSYRELAPLLTQHVLETGFTHVQFLPVMEHPFFGSWGYQITGYFAPSSRYGTPQDFMYLVDYLHQNGIGVILDWVPSHFPTDEHGLGYFDGTHLFEHADKQKGFHPDWKSLIFNYGRAEVQSFLISNALFWLDKYHADGLRVDAVASMLYLDYSRKRGEWSPNKLGGRENLEAIAFLRKLNEEVYRNYPDVQTIAEESTSWPMVSRPTYLGGLGFGLKWDMGWMHDTLDYMGREAVHRKYHHRMLTFRMLYGFSENFVLPLSHDEVVHGKASLIGKMSGDDWQKFANLRAMFGYMHGMSGKKLLFMGGEIAQWSEWNHDGSVDWHLLDYDRHQQIRTWVSRLNEAYRTVPALHELDCEPAGFEWVSADDTEQSTLAFLRKNRSGNDIVLVVCNFTPVVRHDYVLGVPRGGRWQVLLNSDELAYGGSGVDNGDAVEAARSASHGRPFSLRMTLPPLSAVFMRSQMKD
ncbi:MAG: 1,4-alpha-glucan branching protein GlgB [Dehalococcoidia bacterium]|nr:1,4-alpha-glucan branching protein GlgB [Dehalococcoidia bacterium]